MPSRSSGDDEINERGDGRRGGRSEGNGGSGDDKVQIVLSVITSHRRENYGDGNNINKDDEEDVVVPLVRQADGGYTGQAKLDKPDTLGAADVAIEQVSFERSPAWLDVGCVLRFHEEVLKTVPRMLVRSENLEKAVTGWVTSVLCSTELYMNR